MSSTPIKPGDVARRTRTITRRDIELFTEITGDRNPIHYDDELAGAVAVRRGRRAGRGDLGAAQRARRRAAARPGQRLPRGVVAVPRAGRVPATRSPPRRPSRASARTSRSRPRPRRITNQDGVVVLDGTAVVWRDPASWPTRSRREGRGKASFLASSTSTQPVPEHRHHTTGGSTMSITTESHRRNGVDIADAVRHPRRRQGPERDREVPVPGHQHLGRAGRTAARRYSGFYGAMQEMQHEHETVRRLRPPGRARRHGQRARRRSSTCCTPSPPA